MTPSRLGAVEPSFAACASGPLLRKLRVGFQPDVPSDIRLSFRHNALGRISLHWNSRTRFRTSRSSTQPAPPNKKPPHGWHSCLVEAAGIEPASASPLQAVLHA